MDFYITDRTFKLLDIVSTNGGTLFSVVTAEDTVQLSTASRRMALDVTFTQQTSALAKETFKVGNYVLYVDKNGKYEWMTILSVEHDPLTLVRTMELEDASLDLLNQHVESYKATQAFPIKYYIEEFAGSSGFKIGVNEISKLSRKLEWDSGATALERIQSVATQFDNAELEFRFEFNGNQLVNRYIDIKKRRGTDKVHTLYVNRDINSIKTKEDIYQLVNAIKPIGGTPDGADKPVDLKGYNWVDPNNRFRLDKTTGIIYDRENIKQWSRTHTDDNYFLQQLDFETTTKNKLVDYALKHLKDYGKPLVSYEVDIANIPYNLLVGDKIKLVDEKEELYLESRVQELKYDYTTDSVEATLSDFVVIESGINDELRKLSDQLNTQINNKVASIPKVYVQQEPPVNPKQGDMWWVVDGTVPVNAVNRLGDLETRAVKENPKIASYKVWDDLKTEWVEQTIDQSVLNIETLNAVTMNGSTINGSEFLNTFKTTVAGQQLEGISTVASGEMEIEYQNLTTNRTGSTRLFSQGFDARVLNSDSSVNQYASLTPAGLSLLDAQGNSGFLTAELVMQFANTARRLYSGASWVGANDIITPTLTMDEVAIGWLFMWQPYNTSTSTPGTWDYTYYLVPKAHGVYNNGKGIVMRLQGASTGAGANDTIFKYVYVSKTQIKGRAENAQDNGAKWVLTGVFSV
ncbi:tail assembly protein [Enterococcus phage vB_EFaS_TV54]|nr:tail assembly protein [Enterococcus phage vB_EFaS_TV54]